MKMIRKMNTVKYKVSVKRDNDPYVPRCSWCEKPYTECTCNNRL